MKIPISLLTGFLLAFTVNAQIRMPGIFGDHMVIQRNYAAPVWGWSSPNEKLVLSFHGQKKEITADRNGKWHTTLQPEAAGGPYELIITGSNTLVFRDVLVGEVWVCSGQSNMEFELKSARDADAETMNAGYPEIRQIKIPLAFNSNPQEDISPSQWNVCSSATAGNFTAVGYFFARELVRRLHIPVGLINTTWGGTMVEAWTSHDALVKSPEFNSLLTTKPDKNFESTVAERKNRLEQQVKILQKNIIDTLPETEWKNPDYNSQAWPKIRVALNWENQQMGLGDLDGIVWYRKEIFLDSNTTNKPVTLSLGKIDDNDETYVNGIWVGSTKNWAENRVYRVPVGVFKTGKNIIAVRVEDTGGGGGFYGDSSAIYIKSENGFTALGDGWSFRIAKITGTASGVGPNDYPGLLFNAMINPLIPYGIRGALWYQGEANTSRAYQYRIAFPLMISDWRKHWVEGDFPFYFVQLASYNADNGNSNRGSSWAELREAQTHTLSLPATGMSVTTDIGESNDIHPKNKQDVGLRLAAIALSKIYGQAGEYSGPMYESMTSQGNKILLSFTHTGNGLVIKDKYGYLKGFEIAGPDHKFHYAKAVIQNNKVLVYADEVSEPVSVHYAWEDDPGEANLYNLEGFPAVPFRTDQWKGLTDEVKYSVGK